MNKKILGIIILVIILIGGLYYYSTTNKVTNDSSLKDDTVIDVEDNEEEVSDSIEETQDAPEVGEAPIVDIAIGELAPDFKLESLDGEQISLSDYRGKIVLVNFWATWCKYCDIEMPDLQKLDNENDDLVVLAVNVMEDRNIVETYINEGGYEFEVVLDTDGEITSNYLVSGFPTSYFIDEDGILLGGVPGMLTYEQMNDLLDSIRE